MYKIHHNFDVKVKEFYNESLNIKAVLPSFAPNIFLSVFNMERLTTDKETNGDDGENYSYIYFYIMPIHSVVSATTSSVNREDLYILVHDHQGINAYNFGVAPVENLVLFNLDFFNQCLTIKEKCEYLDTICDYGLITKRTPTDFRFQLNDPTGIVLKESFDCIWLKNTQTWRIFSEYEASLSEIVQ